MKKWNLNCVSKVNTLFLADTVSFTSSINPSYYDELIKQRGCLKTKCSLKVFCLTFRVHFIL